jgi:hypothetical protein
MTAAETRAARSGTSIVTLWLAHFAERAYRRAKKSIDDGCADYTEAELNAATGELSSTGG